MYFKLTDDTAEYFPGRTLSSVKCHLPGRTLLQEPLLLTEMGIVNSNQKRGQKVFITKYSLEIEFCSN